MSPVSSYQRVVEGHRSELERRPALRALYAHWAKRMQAKLSALPGPSVELGSGSTALSAHLKDSVPEYLVTDLDLHPWVDQAVDACAMPFDAASCANLLAVDMVHHLPEPGLFFDEVRRVLKPGGRCLLLEPFISPVSYPLYKFAHPEPLDLWADPFAPIALTEAAGGPCNEAIATLAFTAYKRRFSRRWPELKVAHLELSDGLVYVLTGGYSRPAMINERWIKRLLPFEDALMRRLGRLFALRVLVVLERAEN